MKTRFSILSVLLCLFSVSSWADTHKTTTDKVTISELTLNPGAGTGSECISISIEGETIYTAYGFDLYLPVGYEFDPYTVGDWNSALDNKPENYAIYPYTSSRSGNTYTHTISAYIQSDGCLRITAYSSTNAAFSSTRGEIVKVYIKATSYAKPGPAYIQIKNCFFTTAAGVQYDATDETISDKVSATTYGTLPINVKSANHYATFISPFDIPESSITGKDLKVYKYSKIDNSKAYFTSQTSIEAYTPYLLYSENEFNETFTGTIDPSKYQESITDDKYVGIIEKQTASEGYILQNQGDGVKFYKIKSAWTLTPGKCYLSTTANEGSKLSFAFDEEEETDGINNINANADANTVYDLQGRKVKNPQQRGIYIENGKKVVRK